MVSGLKDKLIRNKIPNLTDDSPNLNLFPHERKSLAHNVLATKPSAIMAMNADDLRAYKKKKHLNEE